MTSTYRLQADFVALTGREIAEFAAAKRKAGKIEEAAMRESRLPILRDAFVTLDKLAKEQQP